MDKTDRMIDIEVKTGFQDLLGFIASICVHMYLTDDEL